MNCPKCGVEMHFHDKGLSGCIYVICYQCGMILCRDNEGHEEK
jgi:hypothetical protein